MEWLSTTQVGERMGLHRTTVRALVASGRLPALVIRGAERPTIRISSEDLDEFLGRWTDDGDDASERERP